MLLLDELNAIVKRRDDSTRWCIAWCWRHSESPLSWIVTALQPAPKPLETRRAGAMAGSVRVDLAQLTHLPYLPLP